METFGQGVSLKDVIKEFQLEILYMGENDVIVNTADVNRPGLPLTGFTELYQPHRVQIIGREEYAYLSGLEDSVLRNNVEKFLSAKPICVIISSSIEPQKVFYEMAEKYDVPLLRTAVRTSEFMASLINSLRVKVAPMFTRHGVMVEVYGIGILILGDSGIGKSETAIELIKSAERPMCYIGGGVIRSDASDLVNQFLERIDAPVGSSLMGLGAVSSSSERFTGMIGMHGTRLSNTSINGCDLLIVIGARFSDRVISKGSTFARQARIIQIDVDPAEFNKNIMTEIHIVADVKVALERLLAMLPEKLSHKAWMDEIAQKRKRFPVQVSTAASRPKEILEALESVLPEDSYITTEVGQHQMWAAQFLKSHRPRHFLTSGGLGTMGYGTGASIGTQVSHPEARVVNIAGDGSFRMNCNELATIARYQLPIIILVMNNHALGMVRQWQTLFYDHHYSETTLDTPLDWVTLAKAYGIEGMRLMPEDDPKEVLAKAVKLGKAVVIDAIIPTDDKVYPMVAPGASISDMIGFVDMESLD